MHRPVGSFLGFLAVAASALAQYPGAEAPPSEFKVGFDSIQVDYAKEVLGYLAGPETEGRGTGQPGFLKAAEFMAAKFKKYGLKPLGENGTYFQYVPFSRTRMKPGSGAIELASGRSFDQFALSQMTGDLDLRGVPVFVQVDSAQSRFPTGTSFAGRIVILQGPRNARLENQAAGAGAVAVLSAVDEIKAPNYAVRPGKNAAPGRRNIGTIAASAVTELAEAVGSGAAASITGSAMTMMTGERTIRLRASFEAETIGVPNVVGILEGSDPNLRAESVGIGCHLDHLGVQDGVVYPGADDDGSGSTAIVQIARAFHLNPVKPKRSIIFMAFTGEEMGLIGATHYAANPPQPLDKMVAELQMDMVGRNEETARDKAEDNIDTIHLVGSKRISTELHQIIEDVNNRFVKFKFEFDQEDVYTRSDHYAFAAKGVPIAFVFSGFHPDYHQPTDTIEKINFEKLTNSAKLFYLVAQTLANRDLPPKRDVKG